MLRQRRHNNRQSKEGKKELLIVFFTELFLKVLDYGKTAAHATFDPGGLFKVNLGSLGSHRGSLRDMVKAKFIADYQKGYAFRNQLESKGSQPNKQNSGYGSKTSTSSHLKPEISSGSTLRGSVSIAQHL